MSQCLAPGGAQNCNQEGLTLHVTISSGHGPSATWLSAAGHAQRPEDEERAAEQQHECQDQRRGPGSARGRLLRERPVLAFTIAYADKVQEKGEAEGRCQPCFWRCCTCLIASSSWLVIIPGPSAYASLEELLLCLCSAGDAAGRPEHACI